MNTDVYQYNYWDQNEEIKSRLRWPSYSYSIFQGPSLYSMYIWRMNFDLLFSCTKVLMKDVLSILKYNLCLHHLPSVSWQWMTWITPGNVEFCFSLCSKVSAVPSSLSIIWLKIPILISSGKHSHDGSSVPCTLCIKHFWSGDYCVSP